MDTLLMLNQRERERLTVFSQVKSGAISVAQAGRMLRICERQARRIWKRYALEGDAGLIHGLRGRASNFSQVELRERVLSLYRARYEGLNAAHAQEMMALEGVVVPYGTLWRWLAAQGLIVGKRKVKKHRIRRPRRECWGELIQMDGSTHAWFGLDRPKCVLFVMIDDATGRVFARFYESEDTASAFDLFKRYAKRYGLPLGLYVDHDSIYVVNDDAARQACRQAGKGEPLTQFGRAMKELSVTIIAANSPQAKGRVERVNRTLQDRLLHELALAGITDIAGANAYLESRFLEAFNDRFAVAPAKKINAHRKLAGGKFAGINMEDILCLKDRRTVGRDWCVRYASRILQIHPRHERLSLAGRKIQVLEHADGTLKVMHKGRALVYQEIASRPVPPRPPAARTFRDHTPWRPGPNHPWNRRRAVTSEQPSATSGHAADQPRKAVAFQSGSLRSPSFHAPALTP
jgi:transposase